MNIKNALIWIASILLAFSAGYFFNNTQQAEQHSNILQVKPNQTESINLDNTETIALKIIDKSAVNTINDEGVTELDSKSVMIKVKSLLGDSAYMMDLASIAESYSLIQKFSEQEVSEALNELQGSLGSTKNAIVVNLLVGRYAEMNPYGALDFIETNIISSNFKQRYLSAVISVWAKEDPSNAYYWAKENDQKQEGFMSSYKYISIFNGLAKQDISDAFSKLNEMADKGQSTNMAAMGVARVLESSEQFTDFHENSKNLGNESVMNSAITSWVNKDPQIVVDWLNTVESGKEKNKMQDSVLTSWVASEPQNAAEWYMNESNEENRQASANKIVNGWGITDPKQALEWVNRQSDIDTELTTKNLIQSSVYFNVKFAMDNLSALNDENNKQSISRQIYYSLKRKNKKKAESFLNDSPYSEYILKKIEKRRKK